MKFYGRTIIGSLIALAALALVLFGLYQLIRGGTCASGGPYVSTKQCAPGSTEWMFALPVAILIGLSGIWLIKLRGPRPGVAPPATPAAPSVSRPTPSQTAFLEALLAQDGQVFTSTAPQSSTDPVVRLEKLQALRNAGALSSEEFERAKAKVLAEM